MATFTPNYNLKKPAGVDLALVADINSNYNILDTQLNTLDDTSVVHAGREYGLSYYDFDVTPNELRIVNAGAWGTLFDLGLSNPIDSAVKWLLDIQFTGERNTGTDATSLSIRVDRGSNHGGTMIVQGGLEADHTYSSRETAVSSGITTFTNYHPPVVESGLAQRYYFRIACFGEAPNGAKLVFQVSPVGGTSSKFYDVAGRLTLSY